MTFTVTYRGADGALREEVVEAAGRSECFVECKARGIAPVSVREGGRKGSRRDGGSPYGRAGARPSRSDSPTRSGGNHKSSILNLKSSIILAAAVLAVAGGVWWWLGGCGAARPEAAPYQVKADKVVKAVKDVKDLKGVKDATKGPLDVATNVATAASEAAATNVAVVPKGPVYTNKVRAMGHIEAIGIDGKPVPRHKPIFRKPLERALATGLMTMRSAGGSVVANMRKFTDEQIIEMLKEPVTISKDDPENVIEAKLNVQELKERVLRHVKEGGSVRDVFVEIDELACGAAHERHLTRIGLEEAKRVGDPEVVRAWVAARNAELRRLGMEEIRVPAKYRESMEAQPSGDSSVDKANGGNKK